VIYQHFRYVPCSHYSADKELEDSNGDDGWRFDGTVRHLPQGVVPGENGPVPDEKMPIPVSIPDLTEQQPSRSSLATLSSPKTIPSRQGQQQQQQNNHIEQQQVKYLMCLCGHNIYK